MSRPCFGTPRKAESDRRLIVSFHDLHPGSHESCERFISRVAELGVDRITVLAVPRWHGAKPISEDRQCVRWMKTAVERGHEICLHGFFHRADCIVGGPIKRLIARHYTASEGEFFQISYEAALDRMRRGLEILRHSAGLPVVGFTPPAWLMSEGGRAAAKTLGLNYTTTFSEVDLVQTGVRIAAPTVVYSCRSPWRRLVSRGWVRVWAHMRRSSPVLRIAVHPGDFLDPRVEHSLYERIQMAMGAGRQPITYRELIPDGAHSIRPDSLAHA